MKQGLFMSKPAQQLLEGNSRYAGAIKKLMEFDKTETDIEAKFEVAEIVARLKKLIKERGK